MDSNIKIEKFKKGLEEEISQLIRKVYDEFVAHDYSDEGNQFFYEWIQSLRIAERQQNQINLMVALYHSKVIGMIELRDYKYISLLFVDKKFQGQGIAKTLFQESLKRIVPKELLPDLFYVHASPFSIPIYKKLGFYETDSIKEEHGIKYLPMEMKL
jgi:GNAT superfamily N-acetyltransferase